MKKLNLLILTVHFPPTIGGIENYLFHLTANAAHSIKTVTFRVPGAEIFDRSHNLQISRVPPTIHSVLAHPLLFKASLIPMNILLYLAGRSEIKKNACDLVLAGSADACLAASTLSRQFSIPFSAFAYGKDVIYSGRNNLWKRLITYPCLTRSRSVFAISNYTRRVLIGGGVEPDRIKLLSPGVDSSNFKVVQTDVRHLEQTYRLSGSPVILTTGRLVARKGHQRVIEALPLLLKRFPRIKYLIAGQGPNRKHLESIVERMGLRDTVIFTGYLSQAQLSACYQRCQLMVMPSSCGDQDAEGFGIVYLEAGLFAKPVIGINAGGVPDAVEDQGTGILIPPDDQDALVKAISDLLENTSLANRLGRAGRERARAEDWTLKAKIFSEYIAEMSEPWS